MILYSVLFCCVIVDCVNDLNREYRHIQYQVFVYLDEYYLLWM